MVFPPFLFHRVRVHRLSGLESCQPFLPSQFHLLLLPKASASHSALDHTPTSSQFCYSWNEGHCRWPFGRCRFRHACQDCQGDHHSVSCPFWTSSVTRRSRPLLNLEANVDGVKSKAPHLVNSIHTLNNLHFSSSHSSSFFVPLSLSQP